MRARKFRKLSACVSMALGGVIATGLPLSAAEPDSTDVAKSNDLMQKALQAEADGDLLSRQRILSELADRDCPLARSHSGLVKLEDGWQSLDGCIQRSQQNEAIVDYEARKQVALARIANTSPTEQADQHFVLGRWCATQNLLPQAFAHFTRAVELDGDHTAAKLALGYQAVGSEWISPQEILALQSETDALQTSLREFGVPLRKILRAIASARSERQLVTAKQRLFEIEDIGAIPVMQAFIQDASAQVANTAVEWLERLDAPEASAVLATISVLHPDQAIRHDAAVGLKGRPFEEFVPQIIAMSSSPVFAQLAPVFNPDGSLLGYRQAFARENADERQLVVFDNVYARQSVPLVSGVMGGYITQTSNPLIRMVNQKIEESVNQAAIADARSRQAFAQRDNRRILMLNERISESIALATGEEVGSRAAEIWEWWSNRNESEHQKAQSFNRTMLGHTVPRYHTYHGIGQPDFSVPSMDPEEFEARRRAEMRRRSLPQRTDCMVAGTKVMTLHGLQSIEKISTGEFVLTRSINSGELVWKPVISPTVRDPEPTFEVATVEGKFRSTGGHLYWVSGQGWTKARDVKPGDILHGAKEPTVVCSTRETPPEATYNLRVAGNANFFVGDEMILNHDVTDREPTRALVPGLIAKN